MTGSENKSQGPDSLTPVEVAIGMLVEWRQGRQMILITRRPSNGVLGGYWEFPGGKVEPGESVERCLVREFGEELGIQISVTGRLPLVEYQYKHGRIRLVPFFCRREGEGEPRSLEVAEYRWVEPQELHTFSFPPANEALLTRVMQVLRVGSS